MGWLGSHTLPIVCWRQQTFFLHSVCIPFSVGFSKLSASLTLKFNSNMWCPDLITLKSLFSLSDSHSFALLANAGFFTNLHSLTLSLLFAASSWSVWSVFLLCPIFRVGTQSTLNLSHDFAVCQRQSVSHTRDCFPKWYRSDCLC